MDHIPAGLAAVVEPLREADEYRRFQLQRQRGLYNLLTGLPAAFFMAWIAPGVLGFLPAAADLWWVRLSLSVLLFALFCVSCYPTLLLPWVKRRRPDWTAAFLQAPVVNEALTKQFWSQAGFALAGLYLLAFLVGFVDFLADDFGMASFLGLFLAGLHLVAMLVLGWQARRIGDRLIAYQFWILSTLAIVVFLSGQVDPYVWDGTTFINGEEVPVTDPGRLETAYGLFFASLVAPPLLAGLVRLLAPRRWLVR